MGKVKLTLTVDDRVIAHAKLVAKKQRKSLSELVEQLLTPIDIRPENEHASEIPRALSLRGIARGTLSRKTDKQIREMMYKDRYGL